MLQLLKGTADRGRTGGVHGYGLTAGAASALVLNNIWDYQRMDAGRLGLVSEPFSLRQTVDKTLEALSSIGRQKGLAFSADIDPSVPELWPATRPASTDPDDLCRQTP